MKTKDDILLEQAYSKIILKENTNIPYLDKNQMIKKITSVLPSMEVEDIQHVYDMLFEEDDTTDGAYEISKDEE